MSGDECIHRLPNFSLYCMYVACDEIFVGDLNQSKTEKYFE